MRYLTRTMRRPLGQQRGFTLIELMVGIAIAAILMKVGAPFFGDYVVNSRLREGGNMMFTEALMAQSEAVKRNTRVRLSSTGSTLQVLDCNMRSPLDFALEVKAQEGIGHFAKHINEYVVHLHCFDLDRKSVV